MLESVSFLLFVKHNLLYLYLQTLEVECMSLEPKLHELQAKYDLLIDLGQEDGAEDGTGSLWEGEDEPLQEKDSTDQRHSDLLRRLQREKEDLRDELTKYVCLAKLPLSLCSLFASTLLDALLFRLMQCASLLRSSGELCNLAENHREEDSER